MLDSSRTENLRTADLRNSRGAEVFRAGVRQKSWLSLMVDCPGRDIAMGGNYRYPIGDRNI